MDRVLQIQEVIRMVMQIISNDTYYDEKTRTLYNAALTCSSFLGSALDALWQDMHCIQPLFKLLSNYEYNSQAKHGVIWGSILETDRKMFDMYASRVRSYYCEDIDSVDVSAYIHVLRACGRSYIFPNLTVLQMQTSLGEEQLKSKITFLISPSLRNFWMFDRSMSPNAVILNSLQITAPSISLLALYNLAFDDRSFSVICLLPRLQDIILEHEPGTGDLVSFDLSLFLRLSCKETLRHFTVDGLHIIWSAPSLHCGTVEFPLLETIDFGICLCPSISQVAELFRYVMVPNLKRLPIRLGPSPSRPVKTVEARYWHQFFDLIGTATTNHFKILEIMPNDYYPAEEGRNHWEHVGLTVSALPNLENLSLKHFTITLPILCSLDRNDLQKIINCWPSLSKLELASCRSELDFTALLDIAVGLPHLECLDIPLDMRGHLNLEGIPLLAHNLQYIYLHTVVPMEDFTILVRCVDRIFPYLKGCNLYHGEWQGTPGVSSLLFMLQDARKDECGRAILGITGVAL